MKTLDCFNKLRSQDFNYETDEDNITKKLQTKNNFNKAMATAADLVIAEVEEIVPLGTILPENPAFGKKIW